MVKRGYVGMGRKKGAEVDCFGFFVAVSVVVVLGIINNQTFGFY